MSSSYVPNPHRGDIFLAQLCRMILDGHITRVNSSSAYGDWHREALRLACQEFGMTWLDDPEEMAKIWPGMPHLIRFIARRYCSIQGPMDGVMEYTIAPGEGDILNHRLPALRHATNELRNEWTYLLASLLQLHWPDIGIKSTSWDRLYALGLKLDPGVEDDF